MELSANNIKKKKQGKKICLILLSFYIFSASFLTCTMETRASSLEELMQAEEDRKALPVESNEIENWPKGPR